LDNSYKFIRSEELQVIDQGELLKNPNPEELTQRLQAELEFQPDETGEWLVNDEFTETNGVNGREWLPTRVRLSSSGSRLEFGVRKEDVEKYLELSRIAGDNPSDLDHVRSFWPEGSRIGVSEEDGWLFMGADLEPTVDGFQKDYQGIHFGIELALTAGATGKSYDEMKAVEWNDVMFRDAESAPPDGSSTRLFPEKEVEVDDEDGEDSEEDHSSWARDAENLRVYPLETYEKSVSNAPYAVRFSDRTFTGMDARLIARNYRDKDDVRISMTWHVWDEIAEDHGWNHINVALPIPEGVEVKTVEDMSKLTAIELEVDQGDKGKQTVEMPVRVVVEDHKVSIEAEDGDFSLELQEPQCAECGRPMWKFRFPTDEENDFRSDPRQKPIITSSGTSAGNGVYYHTMEDDEGYKKVYCVDDFPVVEERYAEEHPLARRTNAVAAVRAKLDEMGYADIQLLPEQTWPIWKNGYDSKGGLELFAFVEYERNGRKITRRTGGPIILFDGTIIPNMPSREYVEFR
jgi:hypothetical protein